ncbi:uncharacterized protein LOC130666261 isoform X2 [Microplitis mediator]|uniref:uncharacterized protein LOC130666261 isoform X2 n=1 Tax=Microplitis mediator TaxID=375433 RepID=UPI002552CF10|nr:uncharacterized protein LOC130666261 isoform X2 [Microplitis mediator]
MSPGVMSCFGSTEDKLTRRQLCASLKVSSMPRISSVRHQAQVYLTDHKIFEFTNYLITHLLIDEPDNPIQYLADLIGKCLLFKADLGPPPLVFSDRHIDGIFQSFDPLRTGNITLDQYKMAMKLLGIFGCHQKPPECTPDKVDKETFQAEVKNHLIAGLAELVGKSSK